MNSVLVLLDMSAYIFASKHYEDVVRVYVDQCKQLLRFDTENNFPTKYILKYAPDKHVGN